jgi:hypothetical protein
MRKQRYMLQYNILIDKQYSEGYSQEVSSCSFWDRYYPETQGSG